MCDQKGAWYFIFCQDQVCSKVSRWDPDGFSLLMYFAFSIIKFRLEKVNCTTIET
jgi:hypothetical protein